MIRRHPVIMIIWDNLLIDIVQNFSFYTGEVLYYSDFHEITQFCDTYQEKSLVMLQRSIQVFTELEDNSRHTP